MQEMTKFYVYGYADILSTDEFFYIGKGVGNRAERHLKDCQTGITLFHQHLKKMLSQGNQPERHIIDENLTEEQAFVLEIQLIRFYGRIDLGTGCLYNQTNGGDGVSGLIHSDKSRQKISDSHKNRVISAETKLKLTLALSCRKLSSDHTNRIAVANTGKEASFDTRIKMSETAKNRSAAIIEKMRQAQVDLKGRSICSISIETGAIHRIYDSVSAVKIFGYSRECVNNVLNGRQTSYAGYYWKDYYAVAK